MKTAVLVHGHHLHTSDWEEVEWGNPSQGMYGNIPKGIVEALRFEAEIIIFGTGASERDGLTEGEYAVKIVRERIREIPEFQTMGIEDATKWFDVRAVVERTSHNTTSEIRASAKIAAECGAERVIQIACRTHMPRAHATALKVLAANNEVRYLLENWYAIASDTTYQGADVETVVVIEPPHRPDSPPVPFNTTLQKILPLMSDTHSSKLNDALLRAIEKYRKSV